PISKIAVGLYDDQNNEITCARHTADSLPVKVADDALIIGEWYYIRIDNAKDRAGDFNICIKNELGYDHQAGAIEISHTEDWCSADGAFTTKGMTPGGEKLSCAKDKESRNDVWFKFQASSEQVEVEVIPYGTTPISKIAVGLYDDHGNEITCARHFSDSLPVKVAYQALTVGNWYYLRVDNANKRAGDFNLCVKNEISYDFQAGAITVSHTDLWCSPDGAYTTTGMTPEGKKISCSKDKKSRNDVWFKFRASSEQVELEVVPTGATPIGRIVAGIYDESLAELVCASYTADNLPVSISHNDLNLGSWYYIRVDNYDQYQGDFRLCVSGGEVIPDAPSTLAVDF
ncbi:MAG: hypothetical protein KAR17_05210, partial [Cyclobacteriaceae bacterium]|nr:hypothetical protein [Cyclobacteriaceae bacterium]